jgi:hypothetical protein
LTPAALHALSLGLFSVSSVAMGFSQNTCLPFAARSIWSAWNELGEQTRRHHIRIGNYIHGFSGEFD